MTVDPPPSKPHQFSLRFISGKYQGGEFPIVADKELIIGRSNDIDVVLIEDMVSRRHARVILQGESLIIEDLGSTNGTFVNGEKIRRARIKEGDKVLIGTSIIRVAHSDGGETKEIDSRMRLQDAAAGRRTSQVRTMSGNLSEVALVDLLQLFTTSKKSGILVVRRDEDVGRIHLRRGQIVHATINENADVPPLKGMYRLLTWEQGTFELDPPDDREFREEITSSTEAILMEGMRQLDELKRLQPSLPAPSTHLSIPSPLVPPLKDLSATELEILQLAFNHGHVEAVMNHSKTSDLETCEVIVRLMQRNYLRTD
jgi:pSer/pThr/pTyr-binding forkhead associated (FHA) protein